MWRGLATCGLALGALLALRPAAPAMDDEDISKAIRRGVNYVRAGQGFDGTWYYNEIGATALAGLTLLECGVEADEPVVEKAAAAVRSSVPRQTSTYSLSLSILFLDRLGDKADAPLIQAMAERLLAGQDKTGGWNYSCPMLGGDDAFRRLETLARQRNELVGKRDLPRPGPGRPAAPGAAPSAPGRQRGVAAPDPVGPGQRPGPGPGQGVVPELPGRGAGGGQPGAGGGLSPFGSDNSNTQFAILALWVARRHDVSVEPALAKAEGRFRRSQNGDNGWCYLYGTGDASSPTMTCAGLLGLALGHGSANEAALRRKGDSGRVRDPANDPAIKNGLLALSTTIGAPVGNKRPGEIPQLGRASGKAYYFLWSLDRVAVAYGLETIGEKDWYRWGAEIMLSSQLADGSWKGEFDQAGIDTCFGLLFLRRSNLTQDLSASLKGRVRDPGKVVLRADTDVGALKRRMKPGVEFTGSRPGESARPPREGSAEAKRLSSELLRAAPAERERLLRNYKDSSGPFYTEALALAIPQLEGKEKKAAREALAERLTRMTAATLRDKLKDKDPEVRRAAALACGMKDDSQHIPDLISLLDDSEPVVASAAYRALKSLSNEDFGQAAAGWKAWWQKKSGK